NTRQNSWRVVSPPKIKSGWSRKLSQRTRAKSVTPSSETEQLSSHPLHQPGSGDAAVVTMSSNNTSKSTFQRLRRTHHGDVLFSLAIQVVRCTTTTVVEEGVERLMMSACSPMYPCMVHA
ncbi:unnamed protein product, partial [Ectocarpus fasciculatus]